MVSVEPIDLESNIRFSVLGSARSRLSHDRPVVRSESNAAAGFRLRIGNAFEPEPIGDLGDASGIMSWLLRPGRPYSDLMAIDLHATSLYRGRCAADLALRGKWPPGSLAIAAIELAARPVRVMGQRLDQGRITLFDGAAELDVMVPEGTVWTVLLIRLPDAAIARHPALIADLRRALSSTPRALSAESGERLFGLVRDLTVSPPATADRLRMPGEATAVECSLLEAFADALLTARPAAAIDRKEQRRYDLIRRSEREALRASAEPRRLPQLAVAAGASPRLLEYAYRDLYGMGAMQYLRLLRLNEVRRALLQVDQRAVTITSVAFDWGFYHLGDFSAAYKRLFGESPSDTLKHGRTALWPMEGVAE